MSDAVNHDAGRLPELEAVADAMPTAMLVLNRQGIVSLSNPHVNTVLGITGDCALEGKSIWQVLPLGLREVVGSMQREVLIYASDAQRDVELVMPDGKIRLLDVRVAPVNGRCGQPEHFCMVILNASDRQQVVELKKLDQLKSNFLAMISHELRTPLTSIRGAVHLLGESAACSADPARALVNIVQGNSERLIRLVNNLLEMVAIDDDKYSVKQSRVAIGPLVEQAVRRFQPAADAKFLSLDFSGNECEGHVDSERFVQLISYLVENAINFTPHGGRVSVKAICQPDGAVQVTVSDTGCGVPAYAREKIFEKFYQVEDPMTRCCGGAGVGLFLARHIVEQHGGRLWVDSNRSGGADFYALFPARVAAEIATNA